MRALCTLYLNIPSAYCLWTDCPQQSETEATWRAGERTEKQKQLLIQKVKERSFRVSDEGTFWWGRPRCCVRGR